MLSLFDGISCGRVALQRAGIGVGRYFAAEIDYHAIAVSQDNYPDIIQVGDVTKISYKNGMLITEHGTYQVRIDLVIGGSPCQSLSLMGHQEGLAGISGLFYHYHRILEEIRVYNPKVNFLLENVVGNKKGTNEITRLMGVDPISIDSSLLSAQNRKRFYWTDIENVQQPEDSGILLEDILEDEPDETSVLTAARLNWLLNGNGQKTIKKRYSTIDGFGLGKAGCLTARSDASWNGNYVTRNGEMTKLTCTEYERLQTLPDGYTKSAKTSERYKMVGNAWTVDVIAHILKNMKIENRGIVADAWKLQLELFY